ncbi:putative NACHT domain-containing protein [Seiridium unicorne]|uniref:NACHT domain-containing protein n=1 Tax=Seiridium unicorne TaxID=138068 RepID=A0ABR2UY30_9PEZI
MDLVISQSRRLKPEACLGQAVTAFEATLTSEQRASFLATRITFSERPPGVQDVMHITAEIDQKASSAARGSRCFGPRMTRMLESVQQFASIGDVIIGGSQNLIACGVWSLVRTTLLVVSRFVSYLEGLSSLLMEFGQTAPRYQDIVALHPTSSKLRSLVLEYFVQVVDLCQKVVSACNKPALKQIKHIFTSPDVATIRTQLLKHGSDIQEQLAVEEAHVNAASRALLLRMSSADNERQRLEKKLRLLSRYSSFDYKQIWKEARKSGNCTWFKKDQAYQAWKDARGNAVCFVSGKLGSGKSVLLANMVDDCHLDGQKTIVACFFCRADYTVSLRSETIIGALTRQILETLETKVLSDLWDRHASRTPRNDDMVAILHTIEIHDNVKIILDGLDICSRDTREAVIHFLGQLRKRLMLKLCLSYRLEPGLEVPSHLRSMIWAQEWNLKMPDNNIDIDFFIESKLEKSLQEGSLIVGNPSIILEIKAALQKGAKGMFLWVVLQIETIRQQKTDSDIRTALIHLPVDLPATFSEILEKAKGSAEEYQQRTLKLISAASRPLHADELREALSTTPGCAKWNEDQLINNIYDVLSTCGSLIYVDEENMTVNFIHPSVYEFLTGGFGAVGETGFTPEQAHLEMAHVLLTYLNFDIHESRIHETDNSNRELSKQMMPRIFSDRATNTIISSALTPRLKTTALALMMLKSHEDSEFDLTRYIASHVTPQHKANHRFCFLPYAQDNWLEHTKHFNSDSANLISLFNRQFDGVDHSVYLDYPQSEELILAVQKRQRIAMATGGLLPVVAIASLIAGGRESVNVPQPSTPVFARAPSQSFWGNRRAGFFSRSTHTEDLNFPVSPILPLKFRSSAVWAIRNSHDIAFRASLRNAKTGFSAFIHVMSYIRMRMTVVPLTPFHDISSKFCCRLLCFAVLFQDYDVACSLVEKCRLELRWEDILKQVMAITTSHTPLGFVLLRAQLEDGFGKKSLIAFPTGIRAHVTRRHVQVKDHTLYFFHVGDVVLGEDGISRIDKYIGSPKVRRVDWPEAIRVRQEILSWDGPAFASCCKYHSGVSILGFQLCACCIPEVYMDRLPPKNDVCNKEEAMPN